ncbi:MAG: hypothetical protein J6T04_04575 [Bacteroidales bacterium]|nr:hypothetical protein [Bacteroidales bacterium]
MKRYILLLAISVLAFASCSKDDSTPELQEKSGISLDVVCSKLAPTKAGESGVKPGDDAYNENIIKTIDYYFYPEGGTEANSVLHDRVTVNALNQYTMNISIDEDLLNTTLFPRPSTSCQVAVIVNYPGNNHPTGPSGSTKLSDLEALSVVLQLNDGKGKDQSEFVMFGVKEVTLISRKATLIANEVVDVHRIAAKITLDAHIVESTIAPLILLDGGKEYTLNQEWRPMINQMYIYLENGVSNAKISGDPEASKPYSYFKYSQREFTGTMATHPIHGVDQQFHVSHPFYTYPQTWPTADPHEPFLKLVLPWTRVAGDDHEYNPDWATKPHSWGSIQKQFYYRILLPHTSTGFVKNNWYHINLDVAILGSDIDDASVTIEGTYWVVPWGSADPVEADIKGSRYLSVSQLEHTMYNTTTLKIPYVTSNKCEIALLNVTQYDFKNRVDVDKTADATSGNWVTLDDNNNIVINHTLNNNITTTTFDVAPYIYTFRIRHDDAEGATYYRDLTVTQYPAMYIEQEKSNGWVFVKNQTNNSHRTQQSGNTIIWDDNGQPSNINTTNVVRAIGSVEWYDNVDGTGDNNNQYQYTIHVTVLPETSTSSIGDPRVEVGTTLDRLTGLTNYKPAAENTQDIIAPVFKIASSHGKTQSMTYEGARKRCAAYQENGYPAGRWRLPTKAEIEYLVNLSSKNKIPTLFGSNNTVGYWAAGGQFYVAYLSDFITPPDSPTNAGSGAPYYTINGIQYRGYTRCVYDVWYWGDEKDAAHMTTWGGFQTD